MQLLRERAQASHSIERANSQSAGLGLSMDQVRPKPSLKLMVPTQGEPKTPGATIVNISSGAGPTPLSPKRSSSGGPRRRSILTKTSAPTLTLALPAAATPAATVGGLTPAPATAAQMLVK